MDNQTKNSLLDIAEIVDAFRAVPRVILITYGALCWFVIDWYMMIPDPSTQQAALVSAVVGAAAVVIGLYNNSGRSWSKNENTD